MVFFLFEPHTYMVVIQLQRMVLQTVLVSDINTVFMRNQQLPSGPRKCKSIVNNNAICFSFSLLFAGKCPCCVQSTIFQQGAIMKIMNYALIAYLAQAECELSALNWFELVAEHSTSCLRYVKRTGKQRQAKQRGKQNKTTRQQLMAMAMTETKNIANATCF